MLKLIHLPNPHGASYPVDPTAEFEPGMIAQYKLLGNDIMVGVSDGTAPIGIIDDVRVAALTRARIDEIVEIKAGSIITDANGVRVNGSDDIGFLENPHIISNSFNSTMQVVLNPINGTLAIPAGTPLNHDTTGTGAPFDGFLLTANYIYKIASRPGDDSTIGSGKITIYYQRGIYATDQFDTKSIYPLNATLYVGLDGRLTTTQPTTTHPGIAVVTGPPGATNGTLEFMWL